MADKKDPAPLTEEQTNRIKEINRTRATLLEAHNQSENNASAMIPVLEELRGRRVTAHIHGQPLTKAGIFDILQAHEHALVNLGHQVPTETTLSILRALLRMNLSPCRLDIGELAAEMREYLSQSSGSEVTFLSRRLAKHNTGTKPLLPKPQDLVYFGFGRIGRILTRLVVDKAGRGDGLMTRAIVVRAGKDNLEKRAALLQRDSVFGPFSGIVRINRELNALEINGQLIFLIEANEPGSVDFRQYGIEDAILIDNSGKWRDEEGLSKHLLSPGVKSVLLTAPGKGKIPSIVYGINHLSLTGAELIVSAASCTTNAIVPVLKVVSDEFGIADGHLETVHAATNDQNLVDNVHKDIRRSRSAISNIIITTTGAADAVAKALPQLAGKLTGSAIRVPTPNVSVAVLKLRLDRPVTKEELNNRLRQEALSGPLRDQISFSLSKPASTDIIGNRHAGVVDGDATIVNANGHSVVLYVWYDNEWGYACQTMRVIQAMAGVDHPDLPLPPTTV